MGENSLNHGAQHLGVLLLCKRAVPGILDMQWRDTGPPEVPDTWKHSACCHRGHLAGPAGSCQSLSSRAGVRPCVQGLQGLFGENCWKDTGQMLRAGVCIYISVEPSDTLSGQGLK